MKVPELVAPAGNLEKLKLAILYGADAVYLGGKNFSLRSAADNFSEEEIIEGIEFAHKFKRKVFVAINSFLHDSEIERLPAFVKFLESASADGVIASDLGVVTTVRKHSSLPIHLSTQASCLNHESALFWKKQGVKRVVLGRELSLIEAKKIQDETGLEIEMFIHGAMCMAYSGHCVMSTYIHKRDSNRGGCAHNCRFFYELENEKGEKKQSYFYSSKDLMGLSLLESYAKFQISAIKIEGRMKGHHYLGTITKAYAQALKFLSEQGSLTEEQNQHLLSELNKVTHREYFTGSLERPAGLESVYEERENEKGGHEVCGVIVDVLKDSLLVEVKASFEEGAAMELIPFAHKNISFLCPKMKNIAGEEILRTRPGSLIVLPSLEHAEKWNLLRRRLS